jgi:hypothetical protein
MGRPRFIAFNDIARNNTECAAGAATSSITGEGIRRPPHSPPSPWQRLGFTSGLPQKAKPVRQPVADIDAPLISTDSSHKMMSKLSHKMQQYCSNHISIRNNYCLHCVAALPILSRQLEAFSQLAKFLNRNCPDATNIQPESGI